MKKVLGVSLIALMLVCLCCASALAQTTGIAADGKITYFNADIISPGLVGSVGTGIASSYCA